MSIRAKLALLLAAAMTVAAGGAALSFRELQRRALERAGEETLRLLDESVRAMASEAQLARDPLVILDYAARLRRERPEVRAVRVIFAGAPAGDELPQDEDALARRAEVPPSSSGAPEVRVEYALSRGRLGQARRAAEEALSRDAYRVFAACLLGSALLGALAGWGFSTRLVRLERAAAEIGAGRLGTRVDESGSDEVARLARALNAMAARLGELDEMKRRFTSSVTHELRSPLGAIESYAKILLADSRSLGPAEREHVSRIEANASRLAHFVTSLLDAAAIERGVLRCRPKPVDLAAIVADTAAFLDPRARERRQRISVLAEDELPLVYADPDLTVQLATNLLSNALKFSPEGSVVRARLRPAPGGVECEISDEGKGVPPEKSDKLFQPFERLGVSAGVAGTGLGLSICKAIVDLHHGSIRYEPGASRGARFVFFLPSAGR